MSGVLGKASQAMVQHLLELTRTLLACEYVSIILIGSEKDHLRLLTFVSYLLAKKLSEHSPRSWYDPLAKYS
jgi:hypothetical protein